jgi:hypothetical protein
MSKAIRASLLILLLACSARAGYMPNGSPAPPPPQPATAVEEPTDAGQESVTQATTEDGTQGTIAQITLDLLAVLPSLL